MYSPPPAKQDLQAFSSLSKFLAFSLLQSKAGMAELLHSRK
jgi:hypothetical protein